MIVQCKNCQAKYRLDETAIPDQGRKVRCSKCQNVFWVEKTPPPEDELDMQLAEEEETVEQTEETEHPSASQGYDEAFEPTVKIDMTSQDEFEVEEEEEEFVPRPPKPKRKKFGKTLGFAVLIILLLAAAAIALQKMNMVSLPFLGSPEKPVANLVIDPKGLEGKWETNAQVPRIFVIKGAVMNRSKKPRAFIRVRAMLLDRSGKTLKEAWAYCGNPIRVQDLRTKAPTEIQKQMRNRPGFQGMNQRVPPGASIPFTVVFFDVPKEVESYGAEVTEAQIPESA
jgi:predicted Zn finger-like uncharacterized protein